MPLPFYSSLFTPSEDRCPMTHVGHDGKDHGFPIPAFGKEE
jgi:hypothetical protein